MGFQENVLSIQYLLNGGEIQDDRHCARSNKKLLSFKTEKKHIHDFGVYHRVSRYARHSDVARIYIALWVKSKMAAICAKSNYKSISFSTK